MKLSMVVLFSLFLNGCAYLPSVKDRLTVSPQGSDGFLVTVGWNKFSFITNGAQNRDEELVLFIEFAVNEVISRELCKSAKVSDEKRKILGWEGTGFSGIYIQCTE